MWRRCRTRAHPRQPCEGLGRSAIRDDRPFPARPLGRVGSRSVRSMSRRRPEVGHRGFGLVHGRTRGAARNAPASRRDSPPAQEDQRRACCRASGRTPRDLTPEIGGRGRHEGRGAAGRPRSKRGADDRRHRAPDPRGRLTEGLRPVVRRRATPADRGLRACAARLTKRKHVPLSPDVPAEDRKFVYMIRSESIGDCPPIWL